MKNLKLTKMMAFKTLAFFSTLVLVLLYDYLPQRTLELHPQQTQLIDQSVDSTSGGNSKLSWVNKAQYQWICQLNAGAPYPFCGVSVAWSDNPFKQINLTSYEQLVIDLDYTGEAQYIRTFLRNFYPLPNLQDPIAMAKFNSVSTPASHFVQRVSIPFEDFRVADWWIDDNQIPPSDIKPDVSRVIAVGFDIPYPNTLGKHEFTLHSVKAVGAFFTKESLYLGIILFWSALLVSEIVIRNIQLHKQSLVDGQNLETLKAKSASYQAKAEHDKLTGILNREGLNRMIRELQSSHLLHQYSLLVLDIDMFKQVNDQYGHVAGDAVLREIAQILLKNLRSYDICARWGGEEFVVLFHCIDSKNMARDADKVRRIVEQSTFYDGQLKSITVSIGATKVRRDEAFETVFMRADKALYNAKTNGRNKTMVNN